MRQLLPAAPDVEQLFGSPPEVQQTVSSAPAMVGAEQVVMDNRGKALEMLGKGMRPLAVATALGISPALVSQFLADAEFKKEVADRIKDASYAQAVRAERINALEDKCIDAVETSLKLYRGAMKPAESLSLLKIVNSLDRRTGMVGPVSSDMGEEKTATLILPTYIQNAVVNIQVNTTNEVVEVNGREMRTMSTGGVMKELEEFKGRQQSKLLEDNARFAAGGLPGASSVPQNNPAQAVAEVPGLPPQKVAQVKAALNLSAGMIRSASKGSVNARKLLGLPDA
jgi:predicted transcriptional regulator